jgi:signal transduction histidine kinase
LIFSFAQPHGRRTRRCAKTSSLRRFGASALRARELVDDLLTYSRIVNDSHRFEELDLRREVDAAFEDLSQLVQETGTEIENAAPHVCFMGDCSLFARLMLNLLSNAIKYRKPNQISKVRIAAEPAGDAEMRIVIVDNGIGFEPKYATIIFEPFKRLHSRAKYPGSGIGLAICKSIADRHDWRLSINSFPGVGTTFIITLAILRGADRRPPPA